MKADRLFLLSVILVLNILVSCCKCQNTNNFTSAGTVSVKQHNDVLLPFNTTATTEISKTEIDYKCCQFTTQNVEGKLNGTLKILLSSILQTSPSTKNPETNLSNQIHTAIWNQQNTAISNQIETTSNVPTLFQDKCFSYGSCEYPLSYPKWFCRCDNLCNEFKDCCLGFNGSRSNINTSFSFQCLAIGSETTTLTYTQGILAVNTCPDTYKNTSVIEKCYQEDIVTQGTFVAYNTDIIFKNKFCALCNNITDFKMFEVQLYRIFMDNEELKNVATLTVQEKLAVIFSRSQYNIIPPKDTKLRYCILNVLENDDHFCQLYINPFITISRYKNKPTVATIYRNNFCVPKGNESLTNCLAKNYIIKDTNIVGLSVIFSFQSVTSNLPETEDEQCEKWTENMDNSTCQYLETYNDYPITIEFYLISKRNMTDGDWKLVALVSCWNLGVENFTVVKSFDIMVDDQGFIARVTSVVYITKTTFLREALSIEKKMKDAKLVLYVWNNLTENETTISKVEELQNISFSSRSYKHLIITDMPFNSKLAGFNVFTADQRIEDFCNEVSIGLKQIKQAVYLDYRTCLAKGIITEHVMSFTAIMTFVCFSISGFALVVLIILNRKHKLVTSIAMANLENMSISLLLCNILFMTGIWATHIQKVCYVIGVVLHYLWLTFFSFMAISVQSITRTLMKMKSRNPNTTYNERRRRLFLTMAGLVIPLIFVVPSIVVDVYGPAYFSPGYGKSVCFPNQFPANLIFFTGPVISSVGLNVISLTRVIIKICKVRLEIGSMIRKARSYQDAIIYLRIIVLSGIFWIIGIISVLTDSEWLNYIFTLLCGLQGLFMAVANLTTSRSRREQKHSCSLDSKF